MEPAAQTQSGGGYRFESFDAMAEALINLVRWPEAGDAGRDWKIRCKKLEAGVDSKHGRFVCITGVDGGTRYYIYENLSPDRQDSYKRMYSWEHFRDASVLMELLVIESATIFGGSMELIMRWLSQNAETIISNTRYRF